MVRRRSTVRFRNGAPIKDQVRSSLDSSHRTLRMGAVAVLGGIWEILVLPTRFFRTDGARLGGRRGAAGRVRDAMAGCTRADWVEPDPPSAVPRAIRDNMCESGHASGCVLAV